MLFIVPCFLHILQEIRFCAENLHLLALNKARVRERERDEDKEEVSISWKEQAIQALCIALRLAVNIAIQFQCCFCFGTILSSCAACRNRAVAASHESSCFCLSVRGAVCSDNALRVALTNPSPSLYVQQFLGNCIKNSFEGCLAHTTIFPIAIASAVAVQTTSVVLGFSSTLKKRREGVPFSLDNFPVISVDNSYNEAKLRFPSLPMVIPGKMLRLLKNCYVCFIIWDYNCNVSQSKNAPFLYIELQCKHSLFNPLKGIAFLLRRITKCDVVGKQVLLVFQRHPRDNQSDLSLSIFGKIGSTKQRVNSSSSQPWNACSSRGNLTAADTFFKEEDVISYVTAKITMT
nr:hypothetical protein Iba_chr09bCG0570 [Ipomoea batatas]